MSDTLVFKLSATEASQLRSELNCHNFEFRKLNHAQFQVRADGVTASMYNSGKLVVQGREAQAWCIQFLKDKQQQAAPQKASKASGAVNWPDAAYAIGSDEAGKGDSFGGLVVCAVGLTADSLELVEKTTICDSKQMNDALILQLAPWLKENVIYKITNLFPSDYNSQWQQHGGNVNTLLTALHTECIEQVAGIADFQHAVVDRFSPKLPVTAKLSASLPGLKVTEQPRAEEFLPVACASVLARATFLEQMSKLSEELALDIPLGSGRPVASALYRYRDIHGNTNWQKAVKMHFKNVQKFIS
ncbi:MAG: ribonuclease HIII [Planctomycetes bacterium]|nr:ribonuclease HIII [Planctomycetota bacterium]